MCVLWSSRHCSMKPVGVRCVGHNGASSGLQLRMSWTSYQLSPIFLCIQLLPSHRFPLLFSLFVFIKPSHEHDIIFPNVQNKELWGSKKKEIKRLLSERHPTWKTRLDCSLFRMLIHLWASFVLLFSFNYRHKRIFSAEIIQVLVQSRMMIV